MSVTTASTNITSELTVQSGGPCGAVAPHLSFLVMFCKGEVLTQVKFGTDCI